jgi:large subunit ribosomal protein L28
MSQVCELTGKKPITGNTVSHSNRKARTRWVPNLFLKRYEIAETRQRLKVLVSSRAIRNIDKQGGLSRALLKAKDEKLSPQLLKAKRDILKSARKAVKA